jgi:hypothetical protein
MIIILSFYTINNITKNLLEILVIYSNFSVSENNDYLNHAASINRLRTTAMETWLSGLASSGFGIRLHVHIIGISSVPRNFFRGGGSTNSVEDRENRDLGAVAP